MISNEHEGHGHFQIPKPPPQFHHIGHLNTDGCFRCHDGLHKSREGQVLTKDCNTCHTILAQGPPEDMAQGRLEAQPFRHPVDVGMNVTEFKCSQCHNGTSGL